MSTEPVNVAGTERFAQIERLGDPIADYLQQLPVTTAMEVLVYIVVRCFLDVKLGHGMTKLEAFDKYSATARMTLDMNLKAGVH